MMQDASKLVVSSSLQVYSLREASGLCSQSLLPLPYQQKQQEEEDDYSQVTIITATRLVYVAAEHE